MIIESFEILKTSDTNKRFRLALLDETFGLRGLYIYKFTKLLF